MLKTKIDFPQVLQHMHKMRDEFNEIVEELEMLSNIKVKKQIERSFEAEKKGQTRKFTLSELKNELGV